MRDGRRRAWAIGFTGLNAGLLVATVVIASTSRFDLGGLIQQWIWLLPVIAFAATGGLITISRPEHPIGWVFSSLGFLAFATFVPTLVALGYYPPGSTTAAWMTTASDAGNTVTMAMLVPLAALLFPNGRWISPRWRWAVWVAPVVAVIGGAAALIRGGWGGDPVQAIYPSPLAGSHAGLGEALSTLFWPLLVLIWTTGAAALILRFRRSTGVERRQLKWLALAGLLFGVGLPVALLSDSAGLSIGDLSVSTLILSVTMALFPASAGIAILRHGLYDIDVVISRTMTAGALLAFITAVYVGVVVGVGALVGSGTESNLALQVVATALVAVLFQPVRQRLQRWVNRLVLGKRATPYEVLSAFSRQGARASDQAALPGIARLVADGTGADAAVVWLQVAERMEPVAAYPDHIEVDPVSASNGQLPDLPGSLVVPVRHDGELLGALMADKKRGEQVSEQDEEILIRLAASVGVALRNARLTAELRARLEDLEESRHRIVAAQDEARRQLEHDLHEGAQQQLVGLKIRLGAIRRAASATDAPKTEALVGQIIDDADAAMETLRDLARGIYPPLLESEGLASALEAQARKAVLPITVHAAGVGRFSREAESAVYFCVLEALNNVSKYANARSAFIRVDHKDGVLRFLVEDDGDGFDTGSVTMGSGVVGMRDRIDTVGGTLDVASRPGHGTAVRGEVPIEERVLL